MTPSRPETTTPPFRRALQRALPEVITLAYLGLYFAGWAFVRPGAVEAVAGVMAAIAAMAAVRLSRGLVGAWLLAPVAGLLLLATGLSVFGGAWGAFAALASLLAGRIQPPRYAISGGLAAAVVVLLATVVLKRPLVEAVLPLMFGMMAWLSARHRGELERANLALRQAQDQVSRLAVQSERERIARDLHDLLGQALTMTAMKADLAARLMTADPAGSRAELDDIARVARASLAEARATLTGLRNASLDTSILQARLALASAGVQVTVSVDTAGMPQLVAEVFADVVREGATNIVRHAAANHCRIEVHPERGRWRLLMTDDGAGFAGAEGMGVRGMRERLETAGGVLLLARTSSGTALSADVAADGR